LQQGHEILLISIKISQKLHLFCPIAYLPTPVGLRALYSLHLPIQ